MCGVLKKEPYITYCYIRLWKWAQRGLNPRPKDYESSALTAELQARLQEEI